MELLSYDRSYDWYEEIACNLPDVQDYFDFPSTMLAFAESLGSSCLASIEDQVYFRMRGNQLTLITYFCSSEELRQHIDNLSQFYKIKSLNFVNKDMSAFKRRSYGDEWWIDRSWSVDHMIAQHSGKTVWHLRKAVQRGPERYATSSDLNLVEVMELFEQWVLEAKQRHFMVVRGHYVRYIQRYFTQRNNVRIIGLRRLTDRKLMGLLGYEYFQSATQVTLCKLLKDDTFSEFCKYAWITLMQHMLDENVDKAFCGSTADELKQLLGMQHSKSYKLF